MSFKVTYENSHLESKDKNIPGKLLFLSKALRDTTRNAKKPAPVRFKLLK